MADGEKRMTKAEEILARQAERSRLDREKQMADAKKAEQDRIAVEQNAQNAFVAKIAKTWLAAVEDASKQDAEARFCVLAKLDAVHGRVPPLPSFLDEVAANAKAEGFELTLTEISSVVWHGRPGPQRGNPMNQDPFGFGKAPPAGPMAVYDQKGKGWYPASVPLYGMGHKNSWLVVRWG